MGDKLKKEKSKAEKHALYPSYFIFGLALSLTASTVIFYLSLSQCAKLSWGATGFRCTNKKYVFASDLKFAGDFLPCRKSACTAAMVIFYLSLWPGKFQ